MYINNQRLTVIPIFLFNSLISKEVAGG